MAKMKRLPVSLPKDVYNALEQESKDKEISMSEVIRRTLIKELELDKRK